MLKRDENTHHAVPESKEEGRLHAALEEANAAVVRVKAALGEEAALEFAHDISVCVPKVRDVQDLRDAGVDDGNVITAERSLVRQLAEITERAGQSIATGTAALRIRLDAATVRADPDAHPYDITDDYLKIVSTHSQTFFSVSSEMAEDLPLPEKGGAIGILKGEAYARPVDDPDRCRENLAPLDTLFLPEGHRVRLEGGDQIILRNQGYAKDDVQLGLKDFEYKHIDMLIEAGAEGVMIFGPATFTPIADVSLCEHEQDVSQVKALLSQKSLLDRLLVDDLGKSFDDTAPAMMLIFFFSMLATMALGMFAEYISSPIFGGLAVFMGMCSLSSIFITYPLLAWRRRRLLKSIESLPSMKRMMSFASRWGKTPKVSGKFIDEMVENVFTSRQISFYPVRSTLVREHEGVRVIAPLLALPQHLPQDDNIIPLKRKAPTT